MKRKDSIYLFLLLLLLSSGPTIYAQQSPGINKTKVAVIQSSDSPRQDPFMADYDPTRVRPQSMTHFKKLLSLFEEAG